MNILILQPIRPTNPPALRAVADALLARLPDANPTLTFDIRQDDSALEIPAHPSLYMRHATVRNYMLDRYLRDDHDAVLWVDSDLVEYPADLPTRLHDVAWRQGCFCARCGIDNLSDYVYTTCTKCGAKFPDGSPDGCVIAAPLAFLALTEDRIRRTGDASPDRFYDIGGFIERGARARMYPPWFDQQGPVIELDSVGCCYLAPAWLYREGVRYQPPPTDYYVEHWSVMQQARAKGVRIVALTDVRVTHAWLPDYGLEVN